MKDILIRALKTFWQAGLAYIVVEAPVILSGQPTLETLLVALTAGFVGAGASAIYNSLKKAVVPNSKEKE